MNPTMKPTTSIEPLEARIAPATLLPGNRSVTYFDGDGDRVTVTVSKGALALSDFTFVPSATGIAGREQLRVIDLSGLREFDGAHLTITAVPVITGPSQGGDGTVDIGYINATGIDLGSVVVRGDLGAIDVGDTNLADGGLRALSVLSLGGEGLATGAPNLQSDIVGAVGSIRIASELDGARITITGANAGLGSLVIGASMVGRAGVESGSVVALQGVIAAVSIGGDIVGGSGSGSGGLVAARFGTVFVGGSIYGGTGADSGQLFATGSIARVTVGGDLVGGDGQGSGIVSAENIAALSIDGSVLGGFGSSSGRIEVGKNLTALRIGGSLIGGSINGVGSANSGSIFVAEKLTSAAIGGNIRGGNSAAGFLNDGTGVVKTGSIGTMVVGGSLIGGSDNGGDLFDSAAILATGSIGSLTIRGGMFGGDSSANGETNGSAYVEASRITAMTVNGSIFSGTDDGLLSNSGAIRALRDLGTLLVRGSLEGNDHPVIISAFGQPTPTPGVDLAMRSVTVLGRVFNAAILAGYSNDTGSSVFGNALNADAQIGAVRVGGDWIASDLIAGLATGGDGFFGDAADRKIDGSVPGGRDSASTISRLVSVAIGGRAFGDAGGGAVRNGLGAQLVSSLRLGGIVAMPLFAGASNDTFPAGAYPLGQSTGTTNPSGFNLHVFEVAR